MEQVADALRSCRCILVDRILVDRILLDRILRRRSLRSLRSLADDGRGRFRGNALRVVDGLLVDRRTDVVRSRYSCCSCCSYHYYIQVEDAHNRFRDRRVAYASPVSRSTSRVLVD